MIIDPLLTSLLLSRSRLRRRNRETWTELDWEAVKANPATKYLIIRSTKVASAANQLQFAKVDQLRSEMVLIDLGIDEQSIPYVAALEFVDAPDGWQGLRELGDKLSDLEVALLVTGVALYNWHQKNGFCNSCGTANFVATAGWTRNCAKCGMVIHPRTDAAIISLVTNEFDEILLGSRLDWPDNFFSTFAGFVEAGESAEMTVIRELREEAGVVVRHEDIRYRGSQVWPFPASLMLGYQAKVTGRDATADGYEISEVRWYNRDQLKADCEAGKLQLPSNISIARALIQEWYGEPFPAAWLRP